MGDEIIFKTFKDKMNKRDNMINLLQIMEMPQAFDNIDSLFNQITHWRYLYNLPTIWFAKRINEYRLLRPKRLTSEEMLYIKLEEMEAVGEKRGHSYFRFQVQLANHDNGNEENYDVSDDNDGLITMMISVNYLNEYVDY